MNHRSSAAALTLVAAALITACGGKSDTDQMAAARGSMEKQEFSAAIVQLKSALQQNKDLAEGRYLLGKALMETGDFVSASVELRKAQDLKYDPVKVAPLLARALLLQNEGKAVITQFADVTLADKSAQAELKTTLASAYMAADQKDLAQAAIASALMAVQGYPGAVLLQARQAAQQGDFAKAKEQVEAVIARDAKSAEGWLLKGELILASQGDRAAALEAVRQALTIKPKLLQAHLVAVGELMRAGDLAAVTTQLDGLKKVFPNHPTTKLLEAELAFKNKDYKKASDLAKVVVQAFPSHALALQLAGAAEYQLGTLQQAETYLAKAVQLTPDLPLARRLLARIYLRTAQPQRATAILQPEVARGNDPVALQMAAEAAMQSGDVKAAEDLYQRAGKSKPNDPKIRTALAVTQFAKGKGDTAIAELEAITASDSGGVAELALVSAHLRRKEFDKALKVIDGLERKQPGKPLASMMRGRVMAARNDAAGARAAFEKAAQLDPLYFPAVAALAAVDLTEGKNNVARKRFDEVLKRDPKHLQATLSLAGLLARTGDGADEVPKLLASAVQIAPSDPRTHLQRTQYLLDRRDAKAALAAAREGIAAVPDQPDLLVALGRAFMGVDDMQQAITTFNRLAVVQPKSPQAYLGLADANLALKDRPTAARNLKRALELAPGMLVAQRGLVALSLTDKKPQEALDLARQIQKERPDQAVGFMLEGDVETSRKNLKGAQVLYQAALKKKEPAEAALRLHDNLTASGQAGEAEIFAQRWMSENPKDVAFPFYLADRALADKNLAMAEVRYREVLKLQPNNPLALNNLAWLAVKMSKTGAVEYAEKANKLLPGRPALMDTLATALAYEKQVPRAVEVQKQAVEKAPNDGGLRVNLAKLYIQADQKGLARAELERVSKLGRAYGGQAEVQELLKTL